jgi:hypothetical protein
MLTHLDIGEKKMNIKLKYKSGFLLGNAWYAHNVNAWYAPKNRNS